MPTEFSSLNLAKVRQLRPFKIDYSRVRNLQYIDKNNLRLQAFADYQRLIPPAAIVTEEQVRPAFPADLRYLQTYSSLQFPKGKMLVLVNYDLYPLVKASIDQYVKDVACEGYFAIAHRVKGGTPKELRSFIKGKLPVAGVLMVGSLTTAWFEMDDDFYNAHSEFPCDLYYMDLNGTWNDPDNDGKFSEHPSGVEPEIWIGRLWTPAGSGNDAALINDYLARNTSSEKACSVTQIAPWPTWMTTGPASTTAPLTRCSRRRISRS